MSCTWSHWMSMGKSAALAALSGLAAAPVAGSGQFVNGSFEQHAEGWELVTIAVPEGEAFAEARFDVVDYHFEAGDHTTATIDVVAIAGELFGESLPDSRATSRVELRQKLLGIDATLLSFDWSIGFAGTISDHGQSRYRARLTARRLPTLADPEPVELVYVFVDGGRVSTDLDCGLAVSFDGSRRYRRITLDLESAGLRRGDDVEVAIELEASTWAPGTCDYGSLLATLLVDRFRLEPHWVRPMRSPSEVRSHGLSDAR